MIIILIQINGMMRVGNTYRVREQLVVCTVHSSCQTEAL